MSLLGTAIAGVEYSKNTTASSALPATVNAGDTAVFAAVTVYANSTKATVAGQRNLSYVIEADTPTTAIANLITKGFNNANQLLFTQQARYRIAAGGTLTSISIDVQFSTVSTNHVVYTKS